MSVSWPSGASQVAARPVPINNTERKDSAMTQQFGTITLRGASSIPAALNLKAGGVCLVAGALIFGTVRLLHGDTPASDPAAALQYVQHRRIYPAVRIFALLAALVTVTGLLGLAASLSRPAAALAARAGATSALVGLAIFGVESTSEGLGLPQLARAAALAGPAEQHDFVIAARAVAEATYGPSLVGMALLIGVPLLLFGLALIMERNYPSWFGCVGALIGVITAVVAAGLFLRPTLLPGALLYGLLGSVLAQLWLAVTGAIMLKQAATTRST